MEEETPPQEREHHEVDIDMSQVKQGEDNVYPCKHCRLDIHLAFDGNAFSLYRQEDIDDVTFGIIHTSTFGVFLPVSDDTDNQNE